MRLNYEKNTKLQSSKCYKNQNKSEKFNKTFDFFGKKKYLKVIKTISYTQLSQL